MGRKKRFTGKRRARNKDVIPGRKVHFESLEPRVLLSADLAFKMTADAHDLVLGVEEVERGHAAPRGPDGVRSGAPGIGREPAFGDILGQCEGHGGAGPPHGGPE
ncbi:MAG: LEPR-XLL domain-containing protein [Deltaproteobacteria bacterium]|nr:LEPR-XLL domain-containing protein [Deltaproteobacteria bacterium]